MREQPTLEKVREQPTSEISVGPSKYELQGPTR
jgi:hypothetical protein